MNLKILNNDQFTNYEQELYALYSEKESSSLNKAWNALKKAFRKSFKGLSEENEDFEFDEWHRETRCLAIYIYTSNFYRLSTLNKLSDLVKSFPDWFIEVECYSDDGEPELLGWVIIEQECTTINETFPQGGSLELTALGFNI